MPPHRSPRETKPSAPATAVVVPLFRSERTDTLDDATLVRESRAGVEAARRQLFERHAPAVERLLFRLLGRSADLADPLCETFRRAFERLDALTEPSGLRVWLFSIAAHVAREHARSARRRSWLSFLPWTEVPELAIENDSADEAREAAARVFVLLDRIPSEARIAFSLRYLEGFELAELARALEVSMSTAQRRLRQAERRFFALAATDPILRDYVREDALGDPSTVLFSISRSHP